MKYNIPKKFSMGGQEIKITMVKTLFSEGQQLLGEFRSLENEIVLATHCFGKALPKSQVEQTFYHEYVHCLFFHCRQDELCGNEELVDLMGEFLYQSIGKKSK